MKKYEFILKNLDCAGCANEIQEKLQKNRKNTCKIQNDVLLYLSLSGCGAVGSALDWGSRGRKFKSSHSDQ